MLPTIIIYLKNNCPLCEETLSILDLLRMNHSFHMEKRDIETNDEWLEDYQLQIPVVVIHDTSYNVNQISYEALDKALSEAEAK